MKNIFILVLFAASLCSVQAQRWVPTAFPIVSTSITTGPAYTNTVLGGTLTAFSDGTTGLEIFPGYPMAVTVSYVCATATNGTFKAYFAPSIGGTNFNNNTNTWWTFTSVGTADAVSVNPRRDTTNFSALLLAGYTHLHCVGFFNNNTNPATSIKVSAGVVAKR